MIQFDQALIVCALRAVANTAAAGAGPDRQSQRPRNGFLRVPATKAATNSTGNRRQLDLRHGFYTIQGVARSLLAAILAYGQRANRQADILRHAQSSLMIPTAGVYTKYPGLYLSAASDVLVSARGGQRKDKAAGAKQLAEDMILTKLNARFTRLRAQAARASRALQSSGVLG